MPRATSPLIGAGTGPTSFTVDTAGLPNVSVNAPADLIGAGSARLHGRIDPNGWATGAQGHFVVTNSASPFDQHSYATSVPADKVTPVTFTVTATGLNPSSTYTYQLQVPSVNGPATQPTTDSVTTIGAPSKVVVTSSPPASAGYSTASPATWRPPGASWTPDTTCRWPGS